MYMYLVLLSLHIISVSATITNEMATVTVDGLECGVIYTIIAGGTRNGDLVGPRSSHGIIKQSCPPDSDSDSNSGNYISILNAT